MNSPELRLAMPNDTVATAATRLNSLAGQMGYTVTVMAPGSYQLRRERRRFLLNNVEETLFVAFVEDRDGTRVRVAGDMNPVLVQHLVGVAAAPDAPPQQQPHFVGQPNTQSPQPQPGPTPVTNGHHAMPTPASAHERPSTSVPAVPHRRVDPDPQPSTPAVAWMADDQRGSGEVAINQPMPGGPLLTARPGVRPAGLISSVPGVPPPVRRHSEPPDDAPSAAPTPAEPPSPRPLTERPVLRRPDGIVVALDRPVVIGRNPDAQAALAGSVPLSIEDPSVSKTHASISAGTGLVVVTDLHSTNGTRVEVDGIQTACDPGVPRTIPIQPFSVWIGGARFELEVPA